MKEKLDIRNRCCAKNEEISKERREEEPPTEESVSHALSAPLRPALLNEP